MLTQDQINEAVQASVPNILSGLRREIEERMVREAMQVATAEVQKAVAEWVKVNLIPSVEKALTESKDGLVATGPVMAKAMTDQIGVALAQTVQKKLESSWERKKLFEALVG